MLSEEEVENSLPCNEKKFGIVHLAKESRTVS